MAHARTDRPRVHRYRAARFLTVLTVVSLAVLTIPATPASAVSSELRRYPYLTDLVTTNVTVNWATTTAVTSGSVTYGLEGSEGCAAHSANATSTSITVGSTAEYQWKAELSGLQADARYCYRVFGNGVDLQGSDPSPSFLTQVPAGATTPFSFAVLGDWGQVGSDGTNPDQARVLSQVASSGARFALTTGDNGYPGGSQTDYGDLVQSGSGIFAPDFWTVPGRSIPMFPSQGNHGMNSAGLTNWPQDRAAATSGGAVRMETYCCVNNTSSHSYPSLWYAFDAGPARFYVLEASWANSNVGTSDLYGNDYAAHWTPSSPEYQWLAADLAAHPTALKFAFFHFPLYSANASESSDTWLQGPDSLEGLLGANGVDIVFNGHAHIYARSTPSAPGMPVTYVTGGGGADLASVSRCDAPIAAAIGWSDTKGTGNSCGSLSPPTSIDRVFHFLLVSVNGSQVTVTPTDEMGRTFDVQTYTFGGSSDTEDPSPPTDLSATAASGAVDLTWTAATDNVGVTGYRVLRDGTTIATIGNETSYTDSSVSANTTYTYTVKALDAAGNVSAASAPATVTTPPSSGGTLTFSPTDDAYIAQGSSSSNYGSASSLQVDGSPIKDVLLRFDVTGVGSASVTSATLRLWVVDPSSSGGVVHPTTSTSWSEGSVNWSNAPPTASSPSTSIGSVSTGTWVSVDLGAFVSGDGAVSLRVNSTASNGADYASKEAGSSTAPQLIVTTQGSGGGSTDTEAPNPPTNLSATAANGAVDLSWTAATDNVGVTGYRVLRGGSAIATIGNATSYTDANVSPNATYSYTVRALDAAGNVSADSAPAVVTTPPASGGSQLTFSPTDDAYIVQGSSSSNYGSVATLQTDGSPVKDFLMRFDVNGVGSASVTSATLRLWVTDPSSSGGVVHRTTSSTWSEGSVTWSNAPPSASSPNASIGRVSRGTWVEVDVTSFVAGDGVLSLRVDSTNKNGADYASKEGGASTAPQLVVTTGSQNRSPDTEAPGAPTNLSAAASNGAVDLNWTAATDNVGVAGYRVRRDGTRIATIGNVTSYTDATGAPDTTYSYTVRAFDAADNVSADSAPATVTTPPASGGQLTFLPTDDAYVRESRPTTNHGSASTLQVDGSPVKVTLMRFDVSGVGSAPVTSATLRLWVTDPSSSGGIVHPTSSSWSEEAVTWSNAPSPAASPTEEIGRVSKGSWVEIDVSSFVTGDGTLSFLIDSTVNNGADYASKEAGASTGPQLVVTTG